MERFAGWIRREWVGVALVAILVMAGAGVGLSMLRQHLRNQKVRTIESNMQAALFARDPELFAEARVFCQDIYPDLTRMSCMFYVPSVDNPVSDWLLVEIDNDGKQFRIID